MPWDPKRRKNCGFEGHQCTLAVAFSPDGAGPLRERREFNNNQFSAGRDKSMRLWDIDRQRTP
jgi:hypothetical protein